jgi:hypothetical protein
MGSLHDPGDPKAGKTSGQLLGWHDCKSSTPNVHVVAAFTFVHPSAHCNWQLWPCNKGVVEEQSPSDAWAGNVVALTAVQLCGKQN